MKLKPKFLIGNEKVFVNFIEEINSDDRIGIISHASDLDGILSAILIEDILNNKGIENISVEFIEQDSRELEPVIKNFKSKRVNKWIFTDLYINGFALKNFEELQTEFFEHVLLIDHHPIEPELKNNENIIKNTTSYCSSLAIYLMGVDNDFIEKDKFRKIVEAGAIAEYSFNDEDVLKWLKEEYSGFSIEKRYDFPPGKFCKQLVSTIIYYRDDIKKAYEIIKNQDWKEVLRLHYLVQEEIEFEIQKAKKEIEYFPEKKLNFYYFNPKFRITSVVATVLSDTKPKESFVILSDIPKTVPLKVKISARNQKATRDMNLL
ncbi:MAG: DHH family phosphoesterase, partial [Nanoarchaeota archaeon]